MLKTAIARIAEIAAVAARAVRAFVAAARPLLRGFAGASVIAVMTAIVAGCGGGGKYEYPHPAYLTRANCPGYGDTIDHGGHTHTPLYDAAWNGYTKMVKFLVEKCGEDINKRGGPDDAHRGTPRDMAIRHDHDEMAEYLKSKGGKCRLYRC